MVRTNRAWINIADLPKFDIHQYDDKPNLTVKGVSLFNSVRPPADNVNIIIIAHYGVKSYLNTGYLSKHHIRLEKCLDIRQIVAYYSDYE